MYRNLQKCCFRTSIRLFSSKSEVNLTQLKTSAAVSHQIDQLSPVITKTFLEPRDFSKIVLKDNKGELSLLQLLGESQRVSREITALTGDQQKLNCAFLAAGSFSAVTQYAIWMSGHTAIPLSQAHPNEQIEYFLNDSSASIIVATSEFEQKLKPVAEKLNKPLLLIDHQVQTANDVTDAEGLVKALANELPCRSEDSAMIIYTSGTTSNPKGVVLSHGNLGAQISSLSSAWNMTSSDSLLHTLPLHHVHGIINALLLPLSVGAKVTMLPKFDTDDAWSQLLNINSPQKDRINLFMAVPTIYYYLIQEYDKLFKDKSQMADYIKTQCSTKIRLMISGSAPLPETIFKRWKAITGHNLLERYGMTEIGMALSNPLIEDESRMRRPGFTGAPLPLVQARIVSYDNNKEVLHEAKGEFGKGFWSAEAASSQAPSEDSQDIVGDLQVKGPTVFKTYFNKPEATKESFTADGWFITGDSASFSPQANSFKILGRNSVDILKCKGYKISALEMETKLLENPNIQDVAVIGIPDEVVGQKILALIVTKTEVPVEDINKWCQEKFASYSLPSVKLVESVPRNLMGKVNKKELVKLFS